MKIGFIGLGAMGLPMASLIQRAGHEVTAFDLDSSRLAAFSERGGRVADSPREAAIGAAVVMTSLPTPEASVQAIEDPADGALSAMRTGSCLIEFSTSPLTQVRRICDRAADFGVAFLDAPVSQAAGSVHDGALLVMVGGNRETFIEQTPLLSILASRLMYMGPSGAGTITKLLTQYVGFTSFVTLAEAVTAATVGGVDVSEFLDALALSPGRSHIAERFADWRKLDPEERSGAAPVYLIEKDIRLAVGAIESLGIQPQTGHTAAMLYGQAVEKGWTQRSIMAVLDLIGNDSASRRAPIDSDDALKSKRS